MELDVYWLQQTEADVPPGDDWLSGNERVLLEGLHVAKRRTDWRLGRWTAKCAAASYLKLPLPPACMPEIEIRALPSGAPQVRLADRPAPAAISLSHRGGTAMCAVAAPETAIGCDLEIVEAHSTAFIRDYFTDEEQIAIARAPAGDQRLLVAALWGAKESALKALQEGLRLDTRSVSVRLPEWAKEVHRWYPLQVDYLHAEVFHGWWQRAGNVVRTIAANPRPAMPMLLPFITQCSGSIVPLITPGEKSFKAPGRASQTGRALSVSLLAP
jgi:4'-phosphopantetheinyl transferase